MVYDSVIIGGGPAGISLALTLRARNRSVLIVSGDVSDIPLSRAPEIRNYPGCPDVSGRELLEGMRAQVEAAGVEFMRGHATTAMSMGDTFGIAVGSDFCEGRTLAICAGVPVRKAYPGEKELLGKGISYCATCDGMLYRGRDVCVIGLTADSEEETEALRGMGCSARLFTDPKANYEILGDGAVSALKVNGESFPCAAVFILRPGSAPDQLISGLEMDGASIRVGAGMETSIPGVFAAGDCTGGPFQIAKAAGDGNVAALSIAKYLGN